MLGPIGSGHPWSRRGKTSPPREGRPSSNLPIIWFSRTFGYQIQPDDITNSISVGLVAVAIYYAVKIVRLSDKFEYVALKGGRAPYYIVVGMIFLGVDRLFYLLTNWLLALGFGYQFTAALNDPAAPLAGFFVALGLRDMYVVYIRNSKVKRPVPSHQEIWETEEKEVEYSTAHRANKPSRAREALRPDPAEGAAKAKLDDELR